MMLACAPSTRRSGPSTRVRHDVGSGTDALTDFAAVARLSGNAGGGQYSREEAVRLTRLPVQTIRRSTSSPSAAMCRRSDPRAKCGTQASITTPAARSTLAASPTASGHSDGGILIRRAAVRSARQPLPRLPSSSGRSVRPWTNRECKRRIAGTAASIGLPVEPQTEGRPGGDRSR